MKSKRSAMPDRRVSTAFALLFALGAGMPANAELKGITGSGLYDFLIQTNCFAVAEQADTRTPYWIFDGTYPDNRVPLLAAGTAKGIVRTVDMADQVSFFSSNPAVVQTPAKIQAVGAIGGVPYQQTETYFTIKAPSRPTDVDITAEGSATSVIGTVARLGKPKRVTRHFRVYPPQKISSAAIAPAKTTYADGERLRIEVTLPWKIPFSTTTVVIGRPVYKNAGGHDVRAQFPEWKAANVYADKRLRVPPNSDKVSFEFVARFPSDVKMEPVGTIFRKASFTVPVALETDDYVPCPGLVTNPRSAEVRYAMQKRLDVDLDAKPASSLPSQIQQVPSIRPGSSPGGVPAPRDPLPSKPDPERDPDGKPTPRPKPGIRQ